MNRIIKSLCLVGSLLGGLGAPSALLADNSFGAPVLSCGTDGYKPCSKGGEIVKAIDKGEAKSWGCKGKNLYFTPHKGGQCWSCPNGYKRTLKPIHKGAGACTKRGWGKQTKSSTYVRNSYGCPKGQFHRAGRCLECPDAGVVRGFIGINPKGQCTTKAGCQAGLRVENEPPKVLTKIGRPFVAKCTDLPKNNTAKVLMSTFKGQIQDAQMMRTFAQRFLAEAATSRALKRALKDKDERAAVAAARRLPSFQRLEARARQAGYKTLTVGIGADVQVLVGANQEFGVAFDLLNAATGLYSTTGVSAGLALGVEANIGVGFWTTDLAGLAGYGRGVAISASAGASLGAASWFSYEPTVYQGTTYTAGGGAGIELGELNSALTQVY